MYQHIEQLCHKPPSAQKLRWKFIQSSMRACQIKKITPSIKGSPAWKQARNLTSARLVRAQSCKHNSNPSDRTWSICSPPWQSYTSTLPTTRVNSYRRVHTHLSPFVFCWYWSLDLKIDVFSSWTNAFLKAENKQLHVCRNNMLLTWKTTRKVPLVKHTGEQCLATGWGVLGSHTISKSNQSCCH